MSKRAGRPPPVDIFRGPLQPTSYVILEGARGVARVDGDTVKRLITDRPALLAETDKKAREIIATASREVQKRKRRSP